MAHEHYPKYLYHHTEEPRVVHTEDEHDALREEWKESPADVIAPQVLSEETSAPAEAPKKSEETRTPKKKAAK